MIDEMLALAQRNAAEAGATNVEFLKGTIEAIPLPAESVDVVPTLNVWYHIAFTYDGTTVKLYVNGTMVGSYAFTGTLGVNATDLEIGRYSASSATTQDMRIDEVAVYPTALSAARIAAHYAAR